MRPLVERYGILKHLQDSQLRRMAEEELNPESFGRQFVKTRQNGLGELYAA
jgi:hypothetical protein